MYVFAFDRDWTVDVNPHPRHEAVPLEWVRHLAHETDHGVYAIGNQDLAEEAAIPGVVDIVGRHADDWDDWLGDKQPDGYYERFPERRERLQLIADLHPDAEGYVVVDDIDLSDVTGWDHYHAWEFLPAMRQGAFDPTLPWVDDSDEDSDRDHLVTDGGYPTMAGLVPADASDLRGFLGEYGDAPAFEVRYVENGTEQLDLCWEVSPLLGSYGRAVPPQISCTPLDPGDESFSLPASSVQRVSVVRPPPWRYRHDAETPAERATALSRLASVDASAVPVSDVLAILEAVDEEGVSDALAALLALVADRPGECIPALPILRTFLEEGREPEGTLAALQGIASGAPADVAPLVDAVRPYLDATDEGVRAHALACVAAVATDQPETVVDTVPALAEAVEAGGDGRDPAIRALTRIAGADPAALHPVRETLGTCLAEEDLPAKHAVGLLASLGRLSNEDPDAGLAVLEDVVPYLDDESVRCRANAAGLVSELVSVNTQAVRPHLPVFLELLSEGDHHSRVNASAVVASLAEDFPEDVEPHVDALIDLLNDDHEQVRENACWALGYLGAPAASDALQSRLEDDARAVRDRAAWALTEIDA